MALRPAGIVNWVTAAGIAFALLVSAVPALCVPTDSSTNAARHIGETVVLCGPVMSVKKVADRTFLNFDEPFPNQTFSAMLLGRAHDNPSFDSKAATHYEGRKVCVQGAVYLHDGKPQIKVWDPALVWIHNTEDRSSRPGLPPSPDLESGEFAEEKERPAALDEHDDQVRRRGGGSIVSLAYFLALAVLVLVVMLIVNQARTRARERDRALKKVAAERQAELVARAVAVIRRVAREDPLVGTGKYVARSEFQAWRNKFESELEQIRQAFSSNPMANTDLVEAEANVRSLAIGGEEWLDEYNIDAVKRMVAEEKEFFDTVEAHPLTARQREAVVKNEDNNLVNAAAGSGKTSVVAARVVYLINKALDVSGPVLVLAFARKASEELRQRLEGVEPSRVKVRTFHALGLEIIGEAEGKRPSISPLAEDRLALERMVSEFLVTALLKSSGLYTAFTDFFTTYLDEPQRTTEKRDAGERIREEKSKGLRSLSGVLLKSRDEVAIANWLTLNSVEWEYERQYPHDTASVNRRAYRPDFYLPKFDIYIEHWGIDRNGMTRPGINRPEYLKGITWKRELHRQFGTTLVETESWMRSEKILESTLEKRLTPHGVKLNPLKDAPVRKIAALENRTIRGFVGLLLQFLNLFKANNVDMSSLDRRTTHARDAIFLGLFKPFLAFYQRALEKDNAIDFHDMINLATVAVREGRVTRKYSHIIIDEFQDISESRLALVKALQSQNPGCRLMGVGDDWQSIYRFAGSDVGIITDFGNRVGHFARTDLDATFRFGQPLVEATTEFITRNPGQLRKSVSAFRKDTVEKPISLVPYLEPGMASPAQEASLENSFGCCLRDAANMLGEGASIAVLGRYHFSRPDFFEGFAAQCRSLGIEASFMTAHASKGLEADAVIITGLEAAEFGFPSEVAEDPVLRLVSSATEWSKNSEERRLMYVSLTRARRKVYLVYPETAPSSFVKEFQEGEYGDFVEELRPSRVRLLTCPLCGEKSIREVRPGFFACASYPLCEGRLTRCPECQNGVLAPQPERRPGVWQHECSSCGHKAEACPECQIGALVKRTGKFGQFWGCSEFRGKGVGCEFTRPIR